MSWRDNLHANPSNAEIALIHELQRLVNQGVRFEFRTDQHIPLLVTVPDVLVYTPEREKPLVVYLDGYPHTKRRQQEKDGEINDWLERRGYRFLRFAYGGSMGKKRLAEVIQTIREEARF